MRKYTFTFAETIKYEVEIEAESETEAIEDIDEMSDAKMRENIISRTALETIKTAKGDSFAVSPKKKKVAKAKTANSLEWTDQDGK